MRIATQVVGPLAIACALAAGALAGDRPAVHAQAPTDACAITTASRVVAVGDVHGAFDAFTRILRAAQLINGSNRWVGGSAHLVQVGDVLDRGGESRRVLDLLRRLEREAERDGGRVHALLGNHEVMRMMSDLRYVSQAEYAAFRSGDAEELRDRYYELSREHAASRARAANRRFDERAHREAFLKEIPLGYVEMQLAFGPDGDYGRWLRQRVAVTRINGILFVHGGISSKVAALGCAGINAGVRRELAALPALDDPTVPETLVAGADGPLWYRGLADDASPLTDDDVATLLRTVDASLIVMGHTVAPTLTPRARFGNRVLQIDTGMLNGTFYPGGRPTAVEFVGQEVTAIFTDRRQALFTRGAPVAAGQ